VLNILGEVVYKQYVAFAGDSREEHCKWVTKFPLKTKGRKDL
jgi:hypothetical protein